MDRARVAIIGLGRMASTIDDEVAGYPAICRPYSVAAACAASERLELVAGCDLLPEKRVSFGERYGVTALYDDHATMLAEVKPDLVAICTRAENHAELAVAAAEAGAPAIFCEKAIACSMAEADAVLAAVRSRGIPFNTGCLRRHDSRYQALRQVIAEGGIGKPQAVIHAASATLLHGHIHSIDTALYLLDDPAVARVRGELLPRDLVIQDNRLDSDPRAAYTFETVDGVVCTSLPAGDWQFTVIGSEGQVSAYANGQELGWRQRVAIGERFASSRERPLPEIVTTSATMTLLEDLADALADGRPAAEGVETAHRATEVCLAVAESHRLGGAWVELPLANRDLYVFHV